VKIIYIPVGKIGKKKSEGVRFLLIRHSKYTVLNCRKYIPTDCFYGDFATGIDLETN